MTIAKQKLLCRIVSYDKHASLVLDRSLAYLLLIFYILPFVFQEQKKPRKRERKEEEEGSRG